MKTAKLYAVVLLSVAFASGCASYYKVTDPNSHTVYYTEKVDRQPSGVVVFKDAKTNNEVTLPSSVIEQVPKEQYEAGRNASP